MDTPAPSLLRRAVAECAGTALLAAIVVGSGIMAERLAGANQAVALLCNALATGAGLVALILTFGPVSGAHFNPVVTVVSGLDGGLRWKQVPAYVLAQVVGGLGGVVVAHGMFNLPLISFSGHPRTGPGQWLAEVVATAGLVATIAVVSRRTPAAVPYAVAAWIVAAYWFTSSTSFANPALTFARAFTDSFAGVRLGDVPAFVVVQFVGGGLALLGTRWMLAERQSS